METTAIQFGPMGFHDKRTPSAACSSSILPCHVVVFSPYQKCFSRLSTLLINFNSPSSRSSSFLTRLWNFVPCHDFSDSSTLSFLYIMLWQQVRWDSLAKKGLRHFGSCTPNDCLACMNSRPLPALLDVAVAAVQTEMKGFE